MSFSQCTHEPDFPGINSVVWLLEAVVVVDSRVRQQSGGVSGAETRPLSFFGLCSASVSALVGDSAGGHLLGKPGIRLRTLDTLWPVTRTRHQL